MSKAESQEKQEGIGVEILGRGSPSDNIRRDAEKVEARKEPKVALFCWCEICTFCGAMAG